MLAAGQLLVRIPVALDDDGAITCVGEVPESSLLTMFNAPRVGSPDTVRSLCASIGRSSELLVFYCAGCRLHLKASAADELAALERGTGARLAGAVTLGEIGSLGRRRDVSPLPQRDDRLRQVVAARA